MKRLLKEAGALPFRMLPFALRRRFIQLALEATASCCSVVTGRDRR